MDEIKEKIKKVLKGFALFIILFIIINLFIFVPLVTQQLRSPRHPVAKAYLKSAFMINQLYIFPLSNALGYRNRLTWPFYRLKDKLYQTGMSKLGDDEGEKEIWWYNVRFFEFQMTARKALSEAFRYKTGYIPLPQWQVKELEDWHKEIYSHILSWPKAKISDPAYKKEKLIRFMEMAEAYTSSVDVLSTKLQITEKDYNPKEHKDHDPYAKPDAVKNNMTIVRIFEKLKSDSMKNDKESYEYFEKNKGYQEERFLYKAALNLLKSEGQWGAPVSCSSPEVNILVANHRKLRKYYVENYKNYDKLSPGQQTGLSILITGPIKIPVCKDIPATIEYEKFRQKYSDYIYKKVKYENLADLFK